MIEHLAPAALEVIEPVNLLFLLLGLFVGLFFGAAPGIQGVGAAILFLPFTFMLGPYPSILCLIGIYVGGMSSGAITSILFNIPGEPASIPTTLDGHPLQKKGRGAEAIGIAITSSAVGGIFSAIALMLAAPSIASLALKISSAEYFAFTVFGLTAVVAIGGGQLTKSLVAMVGGLVIGFIGLSPVMVETRLTFGIESMASGIDLIALLMGTFALGEVFDRFLSGGLESGGKAEGSVRVPRLAQLLSLRKCLAVSCLIGLFVGVLPGAGATIASLIAYGVVRQMSKRKEYFGTGEMEGVAAPESANNASLGGALIPLLALGIPGSAFTAVLLGAFTIHGLQPGPRIFTQQPELPAAIVVGLLITTCMLFLVGGVTAKITARLGRMPFHTLDPLIIVLSVVGVYSSRNSTFDVYCLFAFGVIGTLMRRYGYSAPALVLGFVLGPLAERYFTTTVTAANGDYWTFFQRPVCLVLFVLSAIVIAAGVRRSISSSRDLSDELVT